MKTTVNLYLRHEALNDDIAEQEHTIQNKYEEELEVSQVEIKFVVLSYWRRNSLITALYFPGFFAQDTKNLQRYDDQLFLGDLGEGWSWPCLAFGYLYMEADWRRNWFWLEMDRFLGCWLFTLWRWKCLEERVSCVIPILAILLLLILIFIALFQSMFLIKAMFVWSRLGCSAFKEKKNAKNDIKGRKRATIVKSYFDSLDKEIGYFEKHTKGLGSRLMKRYVFFIYVGNQVPNKPLFFTLGSGVLDI